MRRTLIAAAAAMLLPAVPFQAQATESAFTIGLHLVSHHTANRPDDRDPGWSTTGQQRSTYNERNFGAYVRTDAGVTAGLYRNSYRKLSTRIGYQLDLTLPRGWQASLEAAIVTGYPKGQVDLGGTTLRLGAMPSMATPRVSGARARVGYVPDFEKRGGKRSLREGVWHLMVEHQW